MHDGGVLTTPAPRFSPLSPQVYNTDKLRLLLVGPQVSGSRQHPGRPPACRLPPLPATACHTRRRLPAFALTALSLTLLCPPLQLKHTIGALACKGDLTFAAVRGTIVECKRVHRCGEYRGHTADILQLLVLGDRLLSLGRDGKLLVWRIGEYAAPEVAIQLPRCVCVSLRGEGAVRAATAASLPLPAACLVSQHWPQSSHPAATGLCRPKNLPPPLTHLTSPSPDASPLPSPAAAAASPPPAWPTQTHT